MEIKFLKKAQDGTIAEVNSAEDIDTSRLRMFFFSGGGLTDRKEAETVDSTIVEIMTEVGVSPQSIDFYPTYYTDKLYGETSKFNKKTRLPEQYNVEAAEKIFWPLMQESGQRIGLKQAQDNFAKVLLRGHCLGGYVIYEIGNVVVEKMTELGYSPDEIRRITSQTKALITNSGAELGRNKASFESFLFFNLADKTVSEDIEGRVKEQMQALSGLSEQDQALESRIIQYSDHETILVTNRLDMPDDEFVKNYVIYKKGAKTPEEVENMAHRTKNIIAKGHAFRCVFNPINHDESAYMAELRQKMVGLFGGAINAALAKSKKKENPMILSQYLDKER